MLNQDLQDFEDYREFKNQQPLYHKMTYPRHFRTNIFNVSWFFIQFLFLFSHPYDNPKSTSRSFFIPVRKKQIIILHRTKRGNSDMIFY